MHRPSNSRPRRQVVRIALPLLLALGITAGSAVPSSAYSCKAYPEQADAYLKSLIHARSKARENWTTKVKGQYGLAWSVWTISEDRDVSCEKVSGKWTCKAKARPCLYVVP